MSTTSVPAAPHEQPPASTDSRTTSGNPARKAFTPARRLLLAGPALFLLVLLIAYGCGWRLHSMVTPSMGRTAPVGSVVVTSPVSIRDVHVGEIIVFHPPGRPGDTFAHRVVSVTAVNGQPALQTKGDINGSVDGWVLRGPNLVGHERLIVPDLAFVLQALPLLLLGTLAILLITSQRRRSLRGPLRLGLFSLLCSFLIYHFQPLTHIDLITQTVTAGHGQATVVPTGALPLRVRAAGGTHTDLSPGELGSVARAHLPPSGHFRVSAAAHLHGWWWLLLLIVWLAPVAASLRYRKTPRTSTVATA